MEHLGFGIQVTALGLTIVFGLLAFLWLLLSIALRLEARPAPTVDAEASRVTVRARDVGPCPTDPLGDEDGDEVCGSVDNCPAVVNPTQLDVDGNGVGDACQIVPLPEPTLPLGGGLRVL